MLLFSITVLFMTMLCMMDVAEAASITVSPDTTEPGVQPSLWTISAVIDAVAPKSLQSIRLATCCSRTIFMVKSSSTAFGIVGGCFCTYTTTFSTMLIYLPDDCGLSGGTLTFEIPQSMLAVNPVAGDVSVSFGIGSSNAASTTITYAVLTASRSPPRSPTSASPSRSPVSPSPSPRPSPPPPKVFITPDIMDPGAQASSWNITVQDLTPVGPSEGRIFYISSTPSAFRRPSPAPDLVVSGLSVPAAVPVPRLRWPPLCTFHWPLGVHTAAPSPSPC
eukprot:EG_transcript_23336